MSCVGIIDYGVGNLTSVSNMLDYISLKNKVIHLPEQLNSVTHVILPGVGSFKAGMNGLELGGWVDSLKSYALVQQRPILGICLGMQLLASKGYEDGKCKGLSIIPGVVEKIKVDNLRLPHIGWNSVGMDGSRLSLNLRRNPFFYFVHSYHFIPVDQSLITGTVLYEKPMVAILEQGNIFGVQFHPEKSQDAGQQLLLNFCRF